MTLLDAVKNLDNLDPENTIYAAEPWMETSISIVLREPEDGGLPKDAEEQGLKYFLEVFIARDFLEDWISGLDKEPNLVEKCARLIQYAIKDA